MTDPVIIGNAELWQGDCLAVMPTLAADSLDAIVTDPPYGLSFMDKGWDHGIPGPAFWVEALRVAKPGAHLLAFGGSRTFHRLVCAIEDAGWEVRDVLMWVYGSGFPKSLDVSKALDKREGAEREVVGDGPFASRRPRQANYRDSGCANIFGDDAYERPAGDVITAPATAAARQWAGWGTALKPAYEPILLARKPLAGTVAGNVLAHSCGALNIDGCRIHSHDSEGYAYKVTSMMPGAGQIATGERHQEGVEFQGHPKGGRFPANFIHDGSPEVVALFPDSIARPAMAVLAGGTSGGDVLRPGRVYANGVGNAAAVGYDDSETSAARFFYTAKASQDDRDDNNSHPTVKPTSLMRYLCRLITPPDGLILDPFTGSGSTGKAALLEGFRFIGIEQDAEYLAIAAARVRAAHEQPKQMELLADLPAHPPEAPRPAHGPQQAQMFGEDPKP